MAPLEKEPWLRGTLTEIEPVRRQVLHAFQLTGVDVTRWCEPLDAEQIAALPFGLPSVGFHLRHIARSLDRLLTYAEGRALDPQQLELLADEGNAAINRDEVLLEFSTGLERATQRVLAIRPEHFAQLRGVGRELLQVPVAGLLIHCAEHTQRHAGQAITTAKVVTALARGTT